MHTRVAPMLLGWAALLLGLAAGITQGPAEAQPGKGPSKGPKPPDEVEEMMKEIKKAFEPIVDREQEIIKEIRKAYAAASVEQEQKFLKDLRRAFLLTPEQEEAILGQLRKAYGGPSAAQEERIIQEILKAKAIPLGTLIPDSVASRAEGVFRKLDQNGDGLLNFDELPEPFRPLRGQWDQNGNGFIELGEYQAYFQARTQRLLDDGEGRPAQASGSAKAPAAPLEDPVEDEDRKPVVYRAGNLPRELPAWFGQVDADGDGQLSLYEWRMSGRALDELQRMDRNGDGFLTIAELLYWISGRNKLNGVAVVPETKVPADKPPSSGRTFGAPAAKGSDPTGKGPSR